LNPGYKFAPDEDERIPFSPSTVTVSPLGIEDKEKTRPSSDVFAMETEVAPLITIFG
jgi:hypothetical protein